MGLEKTWRWFGKNDSVKLSNLKQMGIEGVVTSLYHIKPGEVWSIDEILALRNEIESYGMRWSVVESLPVSEGIKIGAENREQLIENYQLSIQNLGKCGIDTICYNFMPVLDWARTDLHYINANGCESMLFDYATFAAFDIYILKRKEAKECYPDDILKQARVIINKLSLEEQEKLAHNIIVVTQGFIHGVIDGDTIDYKEAFLNYLRTYVNIDKTQLRKHLLYFINRIIPIAEESGVNLCIHPDDPPFSLLGLPRIVSTQEDLRWIFSQNSSLTNGITFCTGSLSTGKDNDLISMAKEFSNRIHFLHLRNTCFLSDNSFYESEHLNGSVDMFEIIKIMLEEQMNRIAEGRKDIRIPFRPDHGLKLLDDYSRSANPGYPLIGRLKGLAEIDGMQVAIERILKNKY